MSARKVTESVERGIREMIRAQGLAAGAALPGEIELARRFDVSRGAVREGLGRLRAFGVVRSKRRKGMVLGAPDILGGIELILDTATLDQDALRELFEMRYALETGMADLVFHRKTDADLEEMERIVAREEALPVGNADRIECDIAFHAKLFEMSGNDFLSRFQAALSPYFKKAAVLPPVHVSPVTHRALLEILRGGSAADFIAAMRAHLRPMRRRLLPR